MNTKGAFCVSHNLICNFYTYFRKVRILNGMRVFIFYIYIFQIEGTAGSPESIGPELVRNYSQGRNYRHGLCPYRHFRVWVALDETMYIYFSTCMIWTFFVFFFWPEFLSHSSKTHQYGHGMVEETRLLPLVRYIIFRLLPGLLKEVQRNVM